MRCYILLAVLLIATTVRLSADEPTRRAQEELRKRNLYFGDINGQTNPELAEAIKRYQARKGFNPSGELDEETASSLKIRIAESQNTPQPLPDVPVLKSDVARDLAEPDHATLQVATEEEPTSSATPVAPPAEPPSKTEELQGQRVTKFVQDYLHDAEGDDVDLQVRYYAFPVQYFDHGRASRDFVTKDTRNYVKRWPQRKYTLIGPVRFVPVEKGRKLQVEFTIAFSVAKGKQVANGKTRNLWTIQSGPKNFEILAINEQRLHD
jgi:Putative peptidoglycan binding domain